MESNKSKLSRKSTNDEYDWAYVERRNDKAMAWAKHKKEKMKEKGRLKEMPKDKKISFERPRLRLRDSWNFQNVDDFLNRSTFGYKRQGRVDPKKFKPEQAIKNQGAPQRGMKKLIRKSSQGNPTMSKPFKTSKKGGRTKKKRRRRRKKSKRKRKRRTRRRRRH